MPRGPEVSEVDRLLGLRVASTVERLTAWRGGPGRTPEERDAAERAIGLIQERATVWAPRRCAELRWSRALSAVPVLHLEELREAAATFAQETADTFFHRSGSWARGPDGRMQRQPWAPRVAGKRVEGAVSVLQTALAAVEHAAEELRLAIVEAATPPSSDAERTRPSSAVHGLVGDLLPHPRTPGAPSHGVLDACVRILGHAGLGPAQIAALLDDELGDRAEDGVSPPDARRLARRAADRMRKRLARTQGPTRRTREPRRRDKR